MNSSWFAAGRVASLRPWGRVRSQPCLRVNEQSGVCVPATLHGRWIHWTSTLTGIRPAPVEPSPSDRRSELALRIAQRFWSVRLDSGTKLPELGPRGKP